jgi:hypothetical protein
MNRRGWTGQMVNLLYLRKKRMRDVMSDKLKVRMAKEMANIILTSREKVIYTEDIMPSFYKIITEVTTYKSSSTGD